MSYVKHSRSYVVSGTSFSFLQLRRNLSCPWQDSY